MWGALSVTFAFRVHTVRAVRVADLLQDDGEVVYEGTAPVSDPSCAGASSRWKWRTPSPETARIATAAVNRAEPADAYLAARAAVRDDPSGP